MKISRSTDYALRLLIYTALYSEDLATMSRVSDFFKISHEHLRKVVHELGQAGYLSTYQGRYGGFKLAKHPKNINIGDVVSRFEGNAPLIDCERLECRISPSCVLRDVLDEAENAFIQTISKYSLADVIRDAQLQKLFGREEPAQPLV